MSSQPARSLDAALRVIREGGDTVAVRTAIMDLGYEKRPDVYPVLVEELNDPNPAIQHAAVVSLGRFGRGEAIEEIIKPKTFRSPHSNIRWAAVAAIGKLGDYRVIDHLLKAAEDPEWIVRNQAVTEIKAKVAAIIRRRDIRLARLLVHMLSLENEEIVDLAIEGFQEFGLDSLPLLHEALTNSSPTIRANAARALGRLKFHGSTPYLLDLLQDSQWTVRAAAAEALGLIGDRVSVEPLVLKIQDNVSKVQARASAAIVRIGKPATMSLLNSLARERDKFVLKEILLSLGKIGDPKAVPALIGYLRSSYFVVRQAAVAALVRFGPTVVKLVLPALSYNRSDISSLRRDACDKKHPELQLRAIKALGGLEDHRAVELLRELVEKGLPDVQDAAMQALVLIGCASWGRSCALRVLAEVGDASLVPKIIPSLQDDSDKVRVEAVRALGRLGGEEAVKHLVRVAERDAADCLRAEAMRLLRRVGTGQPGVVEAARRGLGDPSRDVRALAARVLGIFQDPKSILPLLKAMEDPHWSVRESAENALLNFGPAASGPLTAALRSPVWTTRFRAARLLGVTGDPKAVPALQRLLARRGERTKVRDVARDSLAKLRPGKRASAPNKGTIPS